MLPIARPAPLFGFFHKPSSHRILFHIPDDAVAFLLISYPAIEALILPKWFPGAPENRIDLSRGEAFDRFSDSGNLDLRLDNDMYVIGHYTERLESIEIQFPISKSQGVHHTLRSGGIS